jgi:hypothetical protein
VNEPLLDFFLVFLRLSIIYSIFSPLNALEISVLQNFLHLSCLEALGSFEAWRELWIDLSLLSLDVITRKMPDNRQFYSQ